MARSAAARKRRVLGGQNRRSAARRARPRAPSLRPEAVRKRRQRLRQDRGMIAPPVEFHEHRFAEALLLAGRINEAEALNRDHLVREAEYVLAEFATRWLGNRQ